MGKAFLQVYSRCTRVWNRVPEQQLSREAPSILHPHEGIPGPVEGDKVKGERGRENGGEYCRKRKKKKGKCKRDRMRKKRQERRRGGFRRRMHFAVAAEYKRAPFCPRGVLRRSPSIGLSFSLALSLLTTTCIRCTHSLEAYAHTHTSARLSPSHLLSTPIVSLPLFSTSFFFRSLCLFLRVDLEGSSEGMLRAARAQLARY